MLILPGVIWCIEAESRQCHLLICKDVFIRKQKQTSGHRRNVYLSFVRSGGALHPTAFKSMQIKALGLRECWLESGGLAVDYQSVCLSICLSVHLYTLFYSMVQLGTAHFFLGGGVPLCTVLRTWYFFLVPPQLRFKASRRYTKMCKHFRSLIGHREFSLPASLDLRHETPNLLDLNSQQQPPQYRLLARLFKTTVAHNLKKGIAVCHL